MSCKSFLNCWVLLTTQTTPCLSRFCITIEPSRTQKTTDNINKLSWCFFPSVVNLAHRFKFFCGANERWRFDVARHVETQPVTEFVPQIETFPSARVFSVPIVACLSPSDLLPLLEHREQTCIGWSYLSNLHLQNIYRLWLWFYDSTIDRVGR